MSGARDPRDGGTSTLLIVLLLGWSASLAAQGGGSLKGKELQPVAEGKTDVQSILGTLLLQDAGTIDRAVVREDKETRLVVTISGADLAGKQVQGEAWGRDRKRQRQVLCDPVVVAAGSTEVELAFALDPSTPEGSEVESAFLHINVMRPGLPAPEAQRTFALGKRWRVAVRPENVTVRVAMVPEGAAARLREEQQQIVMPRVRVLTLASTALLVAPTPTPAPAAPAAAGKARMIHAQPAMMRTAALQPTPTPAPALTARSSLAVSNKLLAVSAFKLGLPEEDRDKGIRGPGTMNVDLLSEVGSDISLPAKAILNLSPQVYQDQNPASGLFYFLPQAYHLEWDPDEGYGMKMLYGAAAGEGQAGDVLMAASLDSGVETGEVQFARELLLAYQRRHPGIAFTELRRMPLDKPPEVSLSGGLQRQYNIAADRISLNAISDALGAMDLQWATDTVTKENLQLALVEDVGITGSMVFTPSGGGLPPQSRPVEIQIADAATFGPFAWQRGTSWRNRTPYPVRLRYMHALLLENNLPIVYSWNLGNSEVAPNAQVEFDASTVPTWLDGRAKRMWLDYSVVRDCQPCDQQVIAGLTGGVTAVAAAQITFHTLTPLADIDAAEIAILVRSKFFDARSQTMQQKGPVVLNADGGDFTVGPIYDNRQPDESGAMEPLFEYQLEVVMKDGTSHAATRWVSADRLRVPIGKVQVQQALGFLPAPA